MSSRIFSFSSCRLRTYLESKFKFESSSPRCLDGTELRFEATAAVTEVGREFSLCAEMSLSALDTLFTLVGAVIY